VQVGDLVKHERTGALGIILEVLDDPTVPAPDIYNVHWSDAWATHRASHFAEELEVIGEV